VRKVPGFGVNERWVPEGALRYLDERGIQGRLFNAFHFGGYITWRDFPRRVPILDGRGHVTANLLEEIHFARAHPEHLERLRARFGLDAAVMDYPTYSGDAFEDVLGPDTDRALTSPDWALVYWDDARNQEILLTSFEQFEGGYWYAPFRPCPDQAGQTQLKRGNHSGPAGPVSDVLEIRYRAFGCADVGPVQEQYAEHLGMLRRIQTTIAGPRTFDLISARVGSLTIDAAPAASFSVSVGPTAGSGPVSATLRLQVNSPTPLTLSFTSGQEYDLALNDNAGNTIWIWSASRTFLQALHQRTVTDEWSETVEIPWPAAPRGRPAARRLHRPRNGHSVRLHALRCHRAGNYRTEAIVLRQVCDSLGFGGIGRRLVLDRGSGGS